MVFKRTMPNLLMWCLSCVGGNGSLNQAIFESVEKIDKVIKKFKIDIKGLWDAKNRYDKLVECYGSCPDFYGQSDTMVVIRESIYDCACFLEDALLPRIFDSKRQILIAKSHAEFEDAQNRMYFLVGAFMIHYKQLQVYIGKERTLLSTNVRAKKIHVPTKHDVVYEVAD